MLDPTIASYNRMARDYALTHSDSIWTPQFHRFRELILGPNILEVGCGPGRDAVHFPAETYNYTGIDGSKEMIGLARKTHPSLHFEIKDFRDLDFSNGSFDGLVAIASLLHIPKKDIEGVLTSITGLLKPKGIGLVSMRKGTGEGYKSEYFPRYFSFYQAEEFRELLESTGNQIVEVGEKQEPDGTEWLYYLTEKV